MANVHAFGKFLYQLCHFYAAWQIVIDVNGQRLKINIAIWSHWFKGYTSAKNTQASIFCERLSRVHTGTVYLVSCCISGQQNYLLCSEKS